MTQVRFLNRNRPRWLRAVSFTFPVLALSLGGCGAPLQPCGNATSAEIDAMVAEFQDWYNDREECIFDGLIACGNIARNIECRNCTEYLCTLAIP